MNWSSWQEFAAMGGHGLFVWGSVLTVIAAVAGELTLVLWRRRAVLEALRRQAGAGR